MLKRCWRCAVSLSAMRRSENGASSSARFTLTTCDENLLGLGTSGSLTKCSSRSMAAFTICGEQLIRMATFWIFWSKGKRDKRAAQKFFRKLLKKLRYVPRLIITDRLRSYGAAKAEVLPSIKHLQQKYQNNRA